MVALDNRHWVGSFDWYWFRSDVKHVTVTRKTVYHKIRVSLLGDHVRSAYINVNPAVAKLILQRLRRHVFDELRVLKASCFVQEIQNWLNINVESDCKNSVVKKSTPSPKVKLKQWGRCAYSWQDERECSMRSSIWRVSTLISYTSACLRKLHSLSTWGGQNGNAGVEVRYR